MPEKPGQNEPVTIFYSYSHLDEELREQLERHLSGLRRRGIIADWHDRKIDAGTEWKEQIDANLNEANVVLLLVSSDFLASDYCYDIEMTRALERHDAGECKVIPVILRDCDWQVAPFGKLQALPGGGDAVSSWGNRDKAFADIAKGIRLAIQGPSWRDKEAYTKVNLIELMIREKRWPLLLVLLVGLYFAFIPAPTDPRFLILSGGTVIASAILYWAVRREKARLLHGGALFLLGGALVLPGVWLALKPVCSWAYPRASADVLNIKPHEMVLTVAKFTPADRSLRKEADHYYKSFLTHLENGETSYPIKGYKTYDAEYNDEQRREAEAQVSSGDCECDVFIGVEVKKQGEATFFVKTQKDSGANSRSRAPGLVTTLKNMLSHNVKDDRDIENLITLLRGLAYYKGENWESAVDVLQRVKDRDEAVFYMAMAMLKNGLQTSNTGGDIEYAIEKFKYLSEKEGADSNLKVAAKLNQACALIDLSQYEETYQGEDPLDSAVSVLRTLIDGPESKIVKDFGECDLARMNLIAARLLKYNASVAAEILSPDEGADRLLDEGEVLLKTAKDALSVSHKGTCPEQRAAIQGYIGNILVTLGERATSDDEFKNRLEEAVGPAPSFNERGMFVEALEHFKKSDLIQDRVTAKNDLASALTYLGAFTGDKKYLDEAKEICRDVLVNDLKGELKDTYPEDWAITSIYLAGALNELGRLGGPDELADLREAIAGCEDVMRARQTPDDTYRAVAQMTLADAYCLLGGNLGDVGMLGQAIGQCDDLDRVFTPNSRGWLLTHAIRVRACDRLAILKPGNRQYYQSKANDSYVHAGLLCGSNKVFLRRQCPR